VRVVLVRAHEAQRGRRRRGGRRRVRRRRHGGWLAWLANNRRTKLR
jgi:hypothetical protein